MNKIQIGVTEASILHTDADEPFDLETRFRMVKESGVYDYYDKTPPSDEEAAYANLSAKYDLPILAGGWFYQLGKDEALLKSNLEMGARLGSVIHNTQIFWRHAEGRPVSNEEVAQAYLTASEIGDTCGCTPTFEVHINMWSEDFRRVAQVAELVESRGVPFKMTLDHSHVIFKIDNEAEHEMFGLAEALADGSVVLDPDLPGNVCEQWIQNGYVHHCHARAAIPNNPRNTFAEDHKGRTGRGVQYPFIEPAEGEYVAPWDGAKLAPWKKVVRQLLSYQAQSTDKQLNTISTEFIPFPDYGGGHKYSIWDNSVACAQWIHTTMEEL
ncbi:MAG: hypothetical protein ACI9ON_003242 [Limisphaerales bacterium]